MRHDEGSGLVHKGERMRSAAILTVSWGLVFPSISVAQNNGDVFDQFFRYTEVKNRAIEPHLPGEIIDHFTGNLRIIHEDLFLPGQGGLDLHILRTYSSK